MTNEKLIETIALTNLVSAINDDLRDKTEVESEALKAYVERVSAAQKILRDMPESSAVALQEQVDAIPLSTIEVAYYDLISEPLARLEVLLVELKAEYVPATTEV